MWTSPLIQQFCIFHSNKSKYKSHQTRLYENHEAFLLRQQHKKYVKLLHSALAGAVWDDDFKKTASYKKLVNHYNNIIRNR